MERNDSNYLMTLPEETRQNILFKLHPFDIHRLCIASTGNLKKYCDIHVWPILLEREFKNDYDTNDNLMWTYLSYYIMKHGIDENFDFQLISGNEKNNRVGDLYWELRPGIIFRIFNDNITLNLYFNTSNEYKIEQALLFKTFEYIFKNFEITINSDRTGNTDGRSLIDITFNSSEGLRMSLIHI